MVLVSIIFLLSLLALVVGVINPSWVKMKSRKRVVFILGTLTFISMLVGGQFAPKANQTESPTQKIINQRPVETSTVEHQPTAQIPDRKLKYEVAHSDSDPSETKELRAIYAHLNRLHTELESEFKRISEQRTPSSAIRKNWGQFSNGWNQNLKKLRNKSVLKNPGILNLKSVTDKTKNSIEFYASNLFLYWQVINDRLNGKKTEQFQIDSLNEDVKRATLDSSKGLTLLENGVDDLEKWSDE